jgi:hypothetical protein
MVSSLPNALLRQIVELTRPDTLHVADYKERQKTLCALSLTSKTFRSIAQPLLPKFILLNVAERVEDVVPRAEECEWAICWLEDETEENTLYPSEVSEWLRYRSSAETVSLQGMWYVENPFMDLTPLNAFQSKFDDISFSL